MVDMKVEKDKLSNLGGYVAGALAVILVLGLIAMAVYARPVADEYAFMARMRDEGVIGYTVNQYMTWSGRVVQSLGLGVAYRMFGVMGAQIVMPMLFLALFGAACSWLIYQMVKFKKRPIMSAVTFGYLAAGVIMYTTACLFDIYLWLDSAIVHFLGMIVIVYDIGVCLWLLKNKEKLKEKKWQTAILLIVAFVGQTVSEASTMLMIGWMGVAFLASLIVKKWRGYKAVLGWWFAVLLVGGLVMILAPGLWARAGNSEASSVYTMFDYLIKAPGATLIKLVQDVKIWEAALVVVVAMMMGCVMRDRFDKKRVTIGVIVGILTMLSFTYVPMVLYFYGSHTIWIESRALAVPAMGLYVGGLIILATLCGWVMQRRSGGEHAGLRTVGYVAVAIICAGVALRGIYRFDKGYLATLSVRAAALEYREAQVANYKNGLTDKLVVADLPVMIEKSNATDFSINGFTVPGWFYDNFLKYYNVEPDDFEVIGEKRDGDAYDWYIEGSPQICTVENVVVHAKYYCANLAAERVRKEEVNK